ncbi:MAG TPA: SMP-30/gluconolactonase/LRE family protein [Planctomycetota bacterium]|nr:SMP-30/gluconolactonase/LRE family protein [Planctomycetota bacterium]
MSIAILALALQLAEGEPTKLATGMKFTEGPVADGKGSVFYTDIPNNRIMKWDGKENAVWRENSGGANGLRFDKDGRLVVCEGGNRRVTRIAPDGTVTVLADQFDGKKLNSPNDLAIDAKGGIYFTDPRYGKRDGMELDKEAVYYIPPGGGAIKRVADDLVRPNGIEVAGDLLYVADAGGKKVYVYGMNPDGTLRDRYEIAPVASDGLKVDGKGNLYTTTGNGVEVFDPEGKPLGTIQVPEKPSNCCFDGRTLYVTARTSLYKVLLK